MRISHRVSALIIGLTIVVHADHPTWGDEELPIDGDPKLLFMMRDALHANASRYPFGEAQVVAGAGPCGEPPQSRVEALVRWDGDHHRITGAATHRGAPPGESQPKLFHSTYDLIYRDGRSIRYNPDGRQMTISRISDWGYFTLTLLRPQDWWYGKVDGGGRSWAEQIDGMLRRPPDILRRVRVRRLGEEQIEMILDTGAAGRFRWVSSLRDDGNLVLAEQTSTAYGTDEKLNYTWTRDQQGRCYLKSCRIERHARKKDGGRGGGCWSYEVIRFDADKRPPRSTFEERAIQVAPGTVVDDRIAGKRRRMGDRPVEGTSAVLDRLIPELKSRGFAAPGREQ